MMLKEFFDQIGVKPYVWAKKHRLPKSALYRRLMGKPIQYGTAVRISKATGGAVSVTEIMEGISDPSV